MNITITPSDPSPANVGQYFSLECSVDDVQHDPLFEWSFGTGRDSLPTGVTASRVINSNNTYSSILIFCPLQASHAGMYTCQFGTPVGGNEVSTMIAINNDSSPSAFVEVTDYGNSRISIGRDHTFRCDLTHDGTSSVATYQWRKDGTLLTKSGPLLTLSFLRLSDAGQYTCEVTVGSKSYCGKNDITLQSKEL